MAENNKEIISVPQTIAVEIEGVAPMLMHNPQTVDPANDWAILIKDLTDKKSKKTREDNKKINEYSYYGALYIDDKIGPYLPCWNIETNIVHGARVKRKGQEALAGINVTPDKVPLIYDGPREAKTLYAHEDFYDYRPAGVDKKKIMRIRPRFDQWKMKFEIIYLPDVISEEQVQEALFNAGRLKGLGDYRPKFGRYVVKKFKSQ